MRLSCFISTLLLVLVWAVPAAAQNDEDNWNVCLGENQAGLAKPEETIKACRHVLSNNAYYPNIRTDAFNNIGAAYMKMKRYDEAISAFGEALRASKPYSTTHEFRQLMNYTRRNRAEAYIITKHYNDALDDFDAIASDEATPENLGRRCYAHALWDDKFASALKDCAAAITPQNQQPDAVSGFLIIQYRQGKYSEIAEDCKGLQPKISINLDARYICGLVERRIGDRTAGEQEVARIQQFGGAVPLISEHVVERFKELGIE